MDWSSELALTTSLSQHKLGLTRLVSGKSGSCWSARPEERVTSSEISQPGDTEDTPALALGWALAMQAQSCAYLALDLQAFAEILSVSQIMCPESTYKRLLDSTETFTRLLDSMRQSYGENSQVENENSVPVLSERLVVAIRSMLDREQVTITVGSTISTERASPIHTKNAGDTR